jgi:hypothetical protein
MKGWIKFSICVYFLFSLIGCQVYPIQDGRVLSSKVFISDGGNKNGAAFMKVLEQQELPYKKTMEFLDKQEELLCDYAKISSGGQTYGLHYIVPVRNKLTKQIDKAFVYKMVDELQNYPDMKGYLSFDIVITEVIVLDEQALNELPYRSRFFPSMKFKQWEQRGLKVAAGLTVFAKELDGKHYYYPRDSASMPSGLRELHKKKRREN